MRRVLALGMFLAGCALLAVFLAKQPRVPSSQDSLRSSAGGSSSAEERTAPVPLVARECARDPLPAADDPDADHASITTSIRGRVLFADGAPAEGFAIEIRPSVAESRSVSGLSPDRRSLTSALGEFEFLEESRPSNVEIEVVDAAPRALFTFSRADDDALAAPGGAWDVGELRLPNLLRLELHVELEPSLRDELARLGGSALQVFVRTGGALRAQPLVDESWPLQGFTRMEHVIWLPEHPSIEVALALRSTRAPIPLWIDGLTLAREPLQRSYGTAEFHFGQEHLIRGIVRREGGLPAEQISVHLFARGAGARTQTALTRTDAEGRFGFVVRTDLTARIWAQKAPERSLDHFACGGQELEIFLDLSRLVRIRWRDAGGQPIGRYYAGAFHLGSRGEASAEHPLALFERERTDGTAELSVERVSAGSRWVLFSSAHGEALWVAPRDCEGGRVIHELNPEDLVRSSSWSLRDPEGQALTLSAPWKLELEELLESPGERTHRAIRYTFEHAAKSSQTALPSILDLRYRYTLHAGDARVAQGVADATNASGREFILAIDPLR